MLVAAQLAALTVLARGRSALVEGERLLRVVVRCLGQLAVLSVHVLLAEQVVRLDPGLGARLGRVGHCGRRPCQLHGVVHLDRQWNGMWRPQLRGAGKKALAIKGHGHGIPRQPTMKLSTVIPLVALVAACMLAAPAEGAAVRCYKKVMGQKVVELSLIHM